MSSLTSNERKVPRIDSTKMREKRRGGGRRRLADAPWPSAFYRARRVDGGVGRSRGSRGHSDDREDGLGERFIWTRASRMRAGRCNHRARGFRLTGGSANLRSAVWSPIKPRVAGLVSKKDDARRRQPIARQLKCFHQNGLDSSVARGRCRPRAVRIRDKWINSDAPTWHKRRCLHGPRRRTGSPGERRSASWMPVRSLPRIQQRGGP